MGDEKREVPRLKKPLIVRYASAQNTGAIKWDETRVVDIGEKGIKITLAREFSVGDILKLQIKVPSRPFDWLEVSAEIVNIEEYKNIFGDRIADSYAASLSFINLGEEQKKLIKDYVSSFKNQDGGGK